MRQAALLLACLVAHASWAFPADITGHIRVTRRLTKKRVAPAAGAYARGVVVAPAADERSFVEAEIGRVAVFLASKQPLPSHACFVELKQENRRFLSDTIVAPVSSTVSFPNLDPIFHNVFSLSPTRSFDLGNYPRNETRRVTFNEPGIVPVYCHLHPNMSATIVVTPNRWATKPDRYGGYALRGAPAGEHTVVVWHKSAGFFRKDVRVAKHEPTQVNFVIPVDPAAGGRKR